MPFCLVGGRARVPASARSSSRCRSSSGTFTLLTPPLHVATPAVYAAWDELGGPTGRRPNDLEPAALQVEPELARYRDQLGDATGQTPTLAGSGSTWFVQGANRNAGRIVKTLPAPPPGDPQSEATGRDRR